MVDISQNDAEPSITDDVAHSGERALLLDSPPGSATANAVRSERALEGPVRLRLWMRTVRRAGPMNQWIVGISDVNAEEGLHLFGSEYRATGSVVHERELGRGGMVRRTPDATVSRRYEFPNWTEIGLVVGRDRTEAWVGRDRVEFEPPSDWIDREKKLEIRVSGWDKGHALGVVVDDLSFGPP
jgi:hypothetical protein